MKNLKKKTEMVVQSKYLKKKLCFYTFNTS